MVGKRDPKNDPETDFLALEFECLFEFLFRIPSCQQITRETQINRVDLKFAGVRSKASFSF